MIQDRRGDMGFMEAVVAFMCVTVVLAAYLGAVAGLAVTSSDPTESLDPDRFAGRIEGGEFVPSFEGYMGEFLDTSGCSGISVSVRIPGGFCAPFPPLTVGTMEGDLFSRVIAITVPDDNGRSVPAVVEVTLCR